MLGGTSLRLRPESQIGNVLIPWKEVRAINEGHKLHQIALFGLVGSVHPSTSLPPPTVQTLTHLVTKTLSRLKGLN